MYGIPEALYSVNTKTFLGNGRLFGRLSLLQKYQDMFDSCNMKLNTIPFFSQWFRGTWERSIQMLATCLYKDIDRGKMNYFFLLTIISDIQRAMNNRPLTYQESPDGELAAITPNMFSRPYKIEEQSGDWPLDLCL